MISPTPLCSGILTTAILAFNSNNRESAESPRFLPFCSSPFIWLGDKRMEELTVAKKDYEKALEEGVAGSVNCSL